MPDAGPLVEVVGRSREHRLPTPFPVGVGVVPGQQWRATIPGGVVHDAPLQKTAGAGNLGYLFIRPRNLRVKGTGPRRTASAPGVRAQPKRLRAAPNERASELRNAPERPTRGKWRGPARFGRG